MDSSIPSGSSSIADRRQFRIQHCLGRGGFGEVYRATMLSAGGVRTDVAVKVLHIEVDPKGQAIQRLRDEGRLLGAVRHPAVLRVHDLCILDGRVALITEYVDGQDLDKCLSGSEPLPLRALVEVIGRVAEALDAAYNAPTPDGQGILELVHRDIKPANIRIGRHGEVKLLDFGIARATNVEREARTESHALLGSFLYMAPERFLDDGAPKPAMDTFALGCTLFEGIAGERLFGELKLKDLYLLVLEERKFRAFLAKRIAGLPSGLSPRVISLLESTLVLDPGARPSHTQLASSCYDLAETLPGDPLQRWARGRHWPEARRMQGMLDGATITETTFADLNAGLTSGSLPARSLRDEAELGAIAPASEGAVPLARPDTREVSLSRTLTATLERPGVVVGVWAMGMLAMGGIASVLLVVVALGAWYFGGGDGGLVVQPADSDIDDVVLVAPPMPEPGAPAPADPDPVPPDAVAAPVPETPDPAPRAPASPPAPVEVTPVPVQVPRPPPRPRPVPDQPEGQSVVTIAGGGVRVEFRGNGGTFSAGQIPSGSYQVFAYFEPVPTETVKFYASPGGVHVIHCSRLRQSCWVDK